MSPPICVTLKHPPTEKASIFGLSHFSLSACFLLARPERFELPTPKFVVWCSIQLSYGRAFRFRGRGKTGRRKRWPASNRFCRRGQGRICLLFRPPCRPAPSGRSAPGRRHVRGAGSATSFATGGGDIDRRFGGWRFPRPADHDAAAIRSFSRASKRTGWRHTRQRRRRRPCQKWRTCAAIAGPQISRVQARAALHISESAVGRFRNASPRRPGGQSTPPAADRRRLSIGDSRSRHATCRVRSCRPFGLACSCLITACYVPVNCLFRPRSAPCFAAAYGHNRDVVLVLTP